MQNYEDIEVFAAGPCMKLFVQNSPVAARLLLASEMDDCPSVCVVHRHRGLQGIALGLLPFTMSSYEPGCLCGVSKCRLYIIEQTLKRLKFGAHEDTVLTRIYLEVQSAYGSIYIWVAVDVRAIKKFREFSLWD